MRQANSLNVDVKQHLEDKLHVLIPLAPHNFLELAAADVVLEVNSEPLKPLVELGRARIQPFSTGNALNLLLVKPHFKYILEKDAHHV